MRPSLFKVLPSYNKAAFRADAVAGLTVALVALPLALAIGVASGLKPENGLITAIVGGFLVSLFGGSCFQIGGPAAAFIGLVYVTVVQFGAVGLLISTMISGVMLMAMGLARLGSLVNRVPECVVTGFTNGIALLIVAAQLKNFLGIPLPEFPAKFAGQIDVIFSSISQTHAATAALGIVSVLLLTSWARFKLSITARLPASVAVLVIGALVAAAYNQMSTINLLEAQKLFSTAASVPIQTIGTQFGSLSTSLLLPKLPWQLSSDPINFVELLQPAISLALLGAIESLLCARIADDFYNKSRSRSQPNETAAAHDSNQELIAQGIGNLVVPLFGGVPVTGTIARTMTNIKSGATSPIAGMLHACILLMIFLIAAPIAKYIPMTVLAAILIWVALAMFDLKSFGGQHQILDRLTVAVTTLLTVLADLTIAVIGGVVFYQGMHWILSRRDRS